MAYSVGLDVNCAEAGCGARATEQVFNNRNGAVAKCCRRHAEELVKRLNEAERR